MKKILILAVTLFVAQLITHNIHGRNRSFTAGFFTGALAGGLISGPIYGNYYAPYVYGYTPYIYDYYAPVYWSPSSSYYWY